MAKKENELKPIVLTDTETGDVYTLEFTRETVKFAELKGFNIDNIDKFPMTTIPDLFYYAFRAHHKNVARNRTDEILTEDLGGLPDGMLARLVELYYKPFDCLLNKEETVKNAKMTVEF